MNPGQNLLCRRVVAEVGRWTALWTGLLLLGAGFVQGEEIIFAVRQPKGPHWYENFGHPIMDENKAVYGAGGRLCKLDVVTGKLTVLLEDVQGAVRDPQVHYDGGRILFSYRKGGTPFYHLYEINSDGSGLKELTSGDYDDIEPSYLPDGGIVFCSSRCRRFVPCWYVQVATIYRCDGNGKNIRPLSSNIEQDNTPWVLPDGRIVYTRWEYVDRSREAFHHLWVMNPDGTGQMTYYGNSSPGDVYLDAKPVPGSRRVVIVNSPAHGRQEHEGRIALVDPETGPDETRAQVILNSGNNFRDPYPISKGEILVVQENRLLRMNRQGETQEIFRLKGEMAQRGTWIHEPRLLAPRPREPVIQPRVNWKEESGELVVIDIYQGRNMSGVKRGTIKKLLILENLPKPVNYTGSMDPISYGGSYTLNRVLGTVPVEADGSANFKVPPLRSLQLVALDDRDLSVKRMLSFLTVMPGERSACSGCHEPRDAAAPDKASILALARAPSEIRPIEGMPEIFDYPRDIQPIWDRHCLKCHDTDKYEGRVLMTGDQGPMFTHSYFSLSARLQMADGRDLARGNYAPYTIGSAASYLMQKLDGSHHDVKVTEPERKLVALWIDASATFPGTYAALGSGMIGAYAALEYGTKPKIDYLRWPAVKEAKEVMDRRCGSCHSGDRKLPSTPADNLGLRLHHLKYGEGKPRFWEPPWIKTYGDGLLRPGSLEWMKQFADARFQFSHNLLYNLSRPEKSVQLLAPLTKGAGGYGICGEVFSSTSDPDYQKLLAGIVEAKAYLDSIKRFNMPGFKPEPEYLRELKRYGVLGTDAAGADVYELDRRYWESLWYRPE